MESLSVPMIIKAVFVFPLTKSLKIQHERLSNLPELYEVIDVDNPMEAGQVLSMENCGIMFCSDGKKVQRCLEKYQKLFLDSKFRIILVLPKRNISQMIIDLNKLGIEDIMVEPVTEKALTTKVDFHLQMIHKLSEAAAKQAQEMKNRGVSQEEIKISQKEHFETTEAFKANTQGLWIEQDKAQQAMKFMPVKGKIQQGGDHIDTMEKSAVSLNALNLYNNAIDGFYKTMKTMNKAPKESEVLTKAHDHEANLEHLESHLYGRNTSAAELQIETHEKKKISVNKDISDHVLDKELGKQELAADHLENNLLHKNGLIIDEPEIALKTHLKKEAIVQETKQDLAHFKDPQLLDNELGKTAEKAEHIETKEKSAKMHQLFENKENTSFSSDKNLHAKENLKKQDDIKKNDQVLAVEKAVLNQPISPNGKDHPKLTPSTEKASSKDVVSSNKDLDSHPQEQPTSQKENHQLSEESPVALKHEEQNQEQKKTSHLVDELSVQNDTKTAAENIEKNTTQVILKTQEQTLGTTSAKKNTLAEKIATHQHAIVHQEQLSSHEKSASKGVSENIVKQDEGKGSTDDVKKYENSGGTSEDIIQAHEKSKNGIVIDGDIKKEFKKEEAFVDEFSKNKVVEKKSPLLHHVSTEKSALGFSLAEIESVVFEEPPKNIIKPNLQALDVGLVLLHKLSTSEQKIEEQSYIFPEISKRIYEVFEGLISFYVVDSKGTPTLLHSSHAERKDFSESLKLPPIEAHVTENITKWSQYRYSTLSDDTLQSDLIEMVYPFKEGGKFLGLALVHCFRTLKETKDVSRLEMLIEFTRGYFLRFHNIGAQGKEKAKNTTGENENAVAGPWYKKYIDTFNQWLNSGKKDTEKDQDEKNKSLSKVSPIDKKSSKKKGAA